MLESFGCGLYTSLYGNCLLAGLYFVSVFGNILQLSEQRCVDFPASFSIRAIFNVSVLQLVGDGFSIA